VLYCINHGIYFFKSIIIWGVLVTWAGCHIYIVCDQFLDTSYNNGKTDDPKTEDTQGLHI